jgi:plasmid stabilization system protein ParE
MAERIVIWTYTVKEQRRLILKYWTVKNGSTIYAEKLIHMISERTKVIAQHPEAFMATDFKHVRVSTLGHFSVFYKYNSTQIIIMAFWDNRQNPERLLENLNK